MMLTSTLTRIATWSINKRRNGETKKKIDGSQPGSLVSLGTQESKDQHAIPSVNRDFILQENASL